MNKCIPVLILGPLHRDQASVYLSPSRAPGRSGETEPGEAWTRRGLSRDNESEIKRITSSPGHEHAASWRGDCSSQADLQWGWGAGSVPKKEFKLRPER